MNSQTAREELLQDESVRQMIADRAYAIAESQGFALGREVENWLIAEGEVLAQLVREREEQVGTNGSGTTAVSATAVSAKPRATKKVSAPKAAVESNGSAPTEVIATESSARPKATKKAPAAAAPAATSEESTTPAPRKRTTKKSAS